MTAAGAASRRMLLALLGLAGCACAHADDPLDDWELSGSNTARVESYAVRGDPLAGPYRFTGGQYFDEFGLNLARVRSPYDTVRGQLYGVVNDSDYRSPDRGVVPERVNLTREKGDAAIPYRAEVGDLFAYFSYRTLQRSLKGVQVELQPPAAEGGVRQSVVLVAGVDQPYWRHLQARDNWTTGASWLVEVSPLARFTANVLHNERQADPMRGLPDRKQDVASVTGDVGTASAFQRLRLEGEVATLRGDHDGFMNASGAIDPSTGRDRHGVGAFAQLSGNTVRAPLDYRLRFERYDRDFRPAEAVIVGDRRSEEGFLGWRFTNGLAVRGRAQQFVDGLQSGNDLRTDTFGATLSGPFATGSSGNVDLFHQDLKKQDASVDRGVWNLNASVAQALPGQWMGTFALFGQRIDDHVAGAADVRSAQLQLGATHAVNVLGWEGSFTPGITLRRVSGGPGAVDEVSPALAFALARNAHSISASYGYQRLRPDETSVATIDVNMLRMEYRYTRGRDTLGLEANAYDRRVTIGEYNDSYRLSLFWTHTFDKPARTAGNVALGAGVDEAVELPHDLSVLVAIPPGADFASTVARLEAAGYRGGIMQGDARVFEVRLLPEVEARQRLVVVEDAGRVARTALVIAIDDPNDGAAVAQAYERVRKAMLDRFGNPATMLEEGAIGGTFAADLNAGRVVRMMEWRTSAGRVRLGIPRRTDGQVRIEIQHAAGFPPPRDGRWSVDAVP